MDPDTSLISLNLSTSDPACTSHGRGANIPPISRVYHLLLGSLDCVCHTPCSASPLPDLLDCFLSCHGPRAEDFVAAVVC
jgi:hypothetical protein